MIEIKGKYCKDIKIFTDNIEQEALSMLYEISDSITVVVSEETGRISIAANGELNSVDQDNFLRVFETYMSQENEE